MKNKKILIAGFFIAILLIPTFSAVADPTHFSKEDEEKDSYKDEESNHESILSVENEGPFTDEFLKELDSAIVIMKEEFQDNTEILELVDDLEAIQNDIELSLTLDLCGLANAVFNILDKIYGRINHYNDLFGLFPHITYFLLITLEGLWDWIEENCYGASTTTSTNTLASGINTVTTNITTPVSNDCGCGGEQAQAYPMGDATQQNTYIR